jgi:hypothetical protein
VRSTIDRGYLMTMMGTTLRILGRPEDAVQLFKGALALNSFDMLAINMIVGAQTDTGVAVCQMYEMSELYACL